MVSRRYYSIHLRKRRAQTVAAQLHKRGLEPHTRRRWPLWIISVRLYASE